MDKRRNSKYKMVKYDDVSSPVTPDYSTNEKQASPNKARGRGESFNQAYVQQFKSKYGNELRK